MTLTDFFSTECSDIISKQILLDRIKEQKSKNVETFIYSGNVFDLEIDFKVNNVHIEENLFFDSNKSMNLTLDQLFSELIKVTPD